MKLGVRVACTTAVLAMTMTSVASALTPTSWRRVTATSGGNIEEVSAARTSDGMLHVVWSPATPGATSSELLHTTVSPSGNVGATTTVAGGWSGIGNPAIALRVDGALVVVAGAQRSTSTTDPILNQALWTSTTGGAAWSLYPADVVFGSGAADPLGLAFGPDGSTPFTAWTTSGGIFVHRGTDNSLRPTDIQAASGWTCCGYDPGIALDQASKRLVVGWYSNATGHEGIYAQAIDPASGTIVGSPVLLPGTLHAAQPSQRTPVVTLSGAGVYIAAAAGYPTATQALVWAFGSGAASTVGQSAGGVEKVSVAADPAGRLWAFWATGAGQGTILHARRSSPGAKAWGAEVAVRAPAGTSELWKLDGNAQEGLLDLLGSFTASGTVSTWDAQILPGLSVSASAKRGGKVTANVADAGQPVAGATVRVLGHSATTSGAGVAHLSIGAARQSRTVLAAASKAGYVGAATRVDVPRG